MEDKVLSFYKNLPFNMKSNYEKLPFDINFYNPLTLEYALKHKNILEIGCGPGHYINALGFQKKFNCTGLDFNEKALEYAIKYSHYHKLDTKFILKDILKLNASDFTTNSKSIFIISNGVLHHTSNCIKALKIILANSIKSNRSVSFLIGLYHLYGRKPFIEHFDSLKKSGMNEELLRAEFNTLRASSGDEINDESWFQDQVNHPRESLHTIKEIAPVFFEFGFKLVNTSIDNFSSNKIDYLIDTEKKYEQQAKNALRNRAYFPGYFTCLFSL